MIVCDTENAGWIEAYLALIDEPPLPVQKYNHEHDQLGKFAAAEGGIKTSASAATEPTTPDDKTVKTYGHVFTAAALAATGTTLDPSVYVKPTDLDGHRSSRAENIDEKLYAINAPKLATAAGITQSGASRFLEEWDSAGALSYGGLAMAIAANKLTGVPLSPQQASATDRIDAATKREALPFLDACYEQSQSFLKDHPDLTDDGQGKTVTLYRGVYFPDTIPPDFAHVTGGAFHETSITANALSSWTSDAGMAWSFARNAYGMAGDDYGGSRPGYVLAAKVPVARIAGLSMAGIGRASQSEFVVIGGTMKVAAMRDADRPGSKSVTKYNHEHWPAGSPDGGKFAPAGTGEAAGGALKLPDVVTEGHGYRDLQSKLPARDVNLVVKARAIVAASGGKLTSGEAGQFLDHWGRSMHYEGAVALRQAMNEKLGIHDPENDALVAEYKTYRANGVQLQADDSYAGPARQLPMKGSWDDVMGKASAFVDAQMTATHEWYATHPDASVAIGGKQYVPLYRGLYYQNGAPRAEMEAELSPVTAASLTAWTANEKAAEQFANNQYGTAGLQSPVLGKSVGMVVKAYVPVERIFSNPWTGCGVGQGYQEHVVIGGWTATLPHYFIAAHQPSGFGLSESDNPAGYDKLRAKYLAVTKYNHSHDEKGRFATADGAGATIPAIPQPDAGEGAVADVSGTA